MHDRWAAASNLPFRRLETIDECGSWECQPLWSVTTRWGGGSALSSKPAVWSAALLNFPGGTYSLQNRAIKVAKSRAPLSIVCRHFAYCIDRNSTPSCRRWGGGGIAIEGLFMQLMPEPWL